MTSREAVFVQIDEKGFVFETSISFRGMTISETSEGFNCVIRGRESNGQAVYAMSVARDPGTGINDLWDAVRRGNGAVLWRLDRYAKTVGQS